MTQPTSGPRVWSVLDAVRVHGGRAVLVLERVLGAGEVRALSRGWWRVTLTHAEGIGLVAHAGGARIARSSTVGGREVAVVELCACLDVRRGDSIRVDVGAL